MSTTVFGIRLTAPTSAQFFDPRGLDLPLPRLTEWTFPPVLPAGNTLQFTIFEAATGVTTSLFGTVPPFPSPPDFPNQAAFQAAVDVWLGEIQTVRISSAVLLLDDPREGPISVTIQFQSSLPTARTFASDWTWQDVLARNPIYEFAGENGSFISGTPGDDRLTGTDGDDTIDGGRGNDLIRGGDGNDLLRGGAGRDTLIGGPGDDTLIGGAGRDRLVGGKGDDLLQGGRGNDRLFGDAGDDTLEGGAGNDRLFGGAGNDLLRGGAGNDTLDGGAGRDTLEGGAGADVLTGGAGADVFVFARIAHIGRGENSDRITDFEGGRDRIDLGGLDLSFDGRSFSGEAGSIRFRSDGEDGRLAIDANGNGRANAVLILEGVTSFDPGDLIL